jgi:hypothetical protein
MKTNLVFVALFLLAIALAQDRDQTPASGLIYGVVVDQDGRPAKGIGLTACPLGVGLGAKLPHTKSNDKGEYRFESLPWWGRYTVYGEDDDAGYSIFSNGPAGNSHPSEVEITREHPEAEFKVYLPPKAGFLQIHLTNRRTNAAIPGMQVDVMPKEKPDSPLFSMGCYSNHVVLVPSDRDLLLHVTSDGFREWNESVGRGKPIHLATGTRLTLDVQLDPLH